MEIKKIQNGNLSTNYLITHKGKALLIDCAVDVQTLKESLNENELVGIIITHGHYDHFKSLLDVLNEFEVKVYLHEKVALKMKNPKLNASVYFDTQYSHTLENEKCVFVEERVYNIANTFNVEFFYAFGHTDDSIFAKIGKYLFVGDFVFENGYGRTDLETGSFEEFKKYYRKYKDLIKNSILFSGH